MENYLIIMGIDGSIFKSSGKPGLQYFRVEKEPKILLKGKIMEDYKTF